MSQRVAKLALAVAFAASAAAAWAGYRQPAFLVDIANATWLCS